MTLLTCLFAALICTILWYKNAPQNEMKLHVLCYLYWGASLMWMVDAVFEYVELGAEFFTPAAADMLNDFYLGLSVVALGMIIWIVYLLIKDPKGVVRAALSKKKVILAKGTGSPETLEGLFLLDNKVGGMPTPRHPT